MPLKAVDVARLRLFGFGFALVIELFALAKPDLRLYVPSGKVKRKRNERQPFLTDLRLQSDNFFFVSNCDDNTTAPLPVTVHVAALGR